MNKPIFNTELSHLSSEAKAFAADLRDWLRNGVNRVTRANRRALAVRFATWIDQEQHSDPAPEPNADKVALRLWIEELDQQGREALTEQLCDFCKAFEIKLAWLVDGELAQWPELETNIEKMVLRYCLACKATVDCDTELRQFRHRRVWKHKIKASTQKGPADASNVQH